MPACFWQPSQGLAMAHVLLALLAAVAGLLSGLPLVAKTVVVLMCAGWAMFRFLQNRQRGATSKRQGLRYQPQAGWQLWRTKTGWQPIEVLAGSLVTRQLVVVYFTGNGLRSRQALVLPAGVLDADSHRRLRVWLRFAKVAESLVR